MQSSQVFVGYVELTSWIFKYHCIVISVLGKKNNNFIKCKTIFFLNKIWTSELVHACITYNLFIYYTFNTCDISATYFADFLWTCFGAVEQTSEEQIKDLFLFFSEINIFLKIELTTITTHFMSGSWIKKYI